MMAEFVSVSTALLLSCRPKVATLIPVDLSAIYTDGSPEGHETLSGRAASSLALMLAANRRETRSTPGQ
jgi:hypothetical protein